MEKYILFRAGREVFGIHISRVVEILNPPKVNPIPEMPDYVAGVITLRGAVIPLVDLRKRFLISPNPVKERIIVARHGAEKVGLMVDEVLEIKGFGPDEISPPPAMFKGLKTEYLKGIAKRKDEVAVLLEIEKVLSSEELILLAGKEDE